MRARIVLPMMREDKRKIVSIYGTTHASRSIALEYGSSFLPVATFESMSTEFFFVQSSI